MKWKALAIVPLVTLITLVVIRILGLGIPLYVTTTTATSADFSVVGEGKIDVQPDIGYVDVGITVSKVATAEDAQDQIATINNQLVAKMKDYGINKEDIKTTNFYINPNYEYKTDGGNYTNGYNGSAQLSIKVKNVEKLGEVAKAATAAGATDVYNTRFSIDSPEKYREQARTKAIDNAKEQAAKIASQLGIRLGKVTNVIESSSNAMPISYDKMLSSDMSGAGGSIADLQPGTQTITSTVTLFFEKK